MEAGHHPYIYYDSQAHYVCSKITASVSSIISTLRIFVKITVSMSQIKI